VSASTRVDSGTATGATSVRSSVLSASSATSVASTHPGDAAATAAAFAHLDLLLSLDVALELIQAEREARTRARAFAGYPARTGERVRDALEELFVLFLQALDARHLAPGFGACVLPRHGRRIWS
jgi:recyclin-1